MYPSLQTSLKITTQLRMTPQLQQAVKLLQYNRVELTEFLNKEMLENPTLEEQVEERLDELPDGAINGVNTLTSTAAGSAVLSSAEQPRDPAAVQSTEIDWNRVDLNDRVHRFQVSSGAEEYAGVDQTLTRPETLAEHLIWQLRMAPLSGAILEVALEIVYNLDERGWFAEGAEGWAAFIGASVEPETILEAARAEVMALDPIGVGALGLKECLQVQLRATDQEGSVAWELVCDHLEALGSRDLRRTARSAGISVAELEKARQLIACLEPRPGRAFVADEIERNPFVTPDVRIYKQGGEWVVHLEEDGLPRLRVSRFYQQAYKSGDLSKEARAYIIDRLRRAEWVTKSIYQRQLTIRRVVESVLRFQHDFFERGAAYLKPLVLRDVADDIGMHESTVSRVTANKYAETPQGLLPLKYFFSARLSGSMGHADVSAEAVRQRINQIIKSEFVAKPYSDAQIVRLLRAEGTEIARRTVAKYREQLKIPAAGKRRVRR